MMKQVIAYLMIWIAVGAFSQDPKALRHFTTSDRSADFYIGFDHRKVKYNDTLFYYWYKSQQVHRTQGYSSGNLLDGPYTQYYVSGQLAESGVFELGLRTGEWKTWYESGQLASVYRYDEGIPNGPYVRYDESGEVTGSGHFRNGKLHGQSLENGEVIEYRRGNRKIRREKQNKDKELKENDRDGGSEPDEVSELKKDKFWSKFFREREKEDRQEKENKQEKKQKETRDEETDRDQEKKKRNKE